MKRIYSLTAVLVLFFTLLSVLPNSKISANQRSRRNVNPRNCGVHCGTERWAVKTLTDSDISRVNFTPKEKSIHDLVHIQNPGSNLPQNNRLDAELSTYKVKAKLVGYKSESDKDFHVVIADPDHLEATMIAEIPSDACDGVCSSGHIQEFRAARDRIINLLGPTSNRIHGLKTPNGEVIIEVTGVGFFDFEHGQTGRAPNGLELHPILKIDVISDNRNGR